MFSRVLDELAQRRIERVQVITRQLPQLDLKTRALVPGKEVHGFLVPGGAEVAPVQRAIDAQQDVQVQVPVAARGERRLDRGQVALDGRELFSDSREVFEDQPQVHGQIAGRDIRPGHHAGVDPARAALLLPDLHRFLVALHQAALFGARTVRAQQRHAALRVPGNHDLAGAAIDTPGATVPAGTQLEGMVRGQQRVVFEVAGELLTDRAALAKAGVRAVAALVDVRIDVGAVRGHGARLRRVGGQRIERAVWWRQPVRQAIGKWMRCHPGGYEFSQGGVHRSWRACPCIAPLQCTTPSVHAAREGGLFFSCHMNFQRAQQSAATIAAR